ncbi:cytochrome P450 [Actinoallomurus sp. NPDC052274]|uniref:cytochrome P450 n=1 Tax=Actinoallomurus sp. NPDC052274 TaxID=3155420 RepID=UPI00342FC263
MTRYEDNRLVLADPRFSRAAAAAPGAPRARRVPLEAASLTTLDPPEHTRVRRLVMGAFTERRIARFADRVQEFAEKLFARMALHGPPADLVADLARPLPFMTICDILGVPASVHDRFRSWTETYLNVTGREPAEIERAGESLRGHLRELVALKRREPGEDLLSALVAARDEELLSESELVALGVTLLVAGYETVVGYLSGAVVALFRHPDQLDRLRAVPGLVPTAVEELLRYTPAPATGGTIRVALEEVRIGGVTIAPGEAVLPAITSADRDAAVFSAPDRLDVTRTPNPHLAFGHGPHRCLGAPLARAQLTIALGGLLRHFPALRPAVPVEELEWQTTGMVRRPVALPVIW